MTDTSSIQDRSHANDAGDWIDAADREEERAERDAEIEAEDRRKTMREIKFRAKMIDDSSWVSGGGVWTFERCTALFGEDENGNPVVHSINPETVGQFTGLLDKNGKEIYEGDVLHQDNYSDWVVVWENAGFHIYNVCNPGNYWPHLKSGREVIGNIYEHPELLTERRQRE